MPESDLLDVKLESLDRCLRRIKEHTPVSARSLSEDYDAQDIVSVNLQRAIQICVDVGGHLISQRGWTAPSTMAETFAVLTEHGVLGEELSARLRRAVGFRNISVHEYETIDWDRVYRLITEHLDLFREFGAAVVDEFD
ncbi:MAG: type VII toxin-antitoxin system HepT family RNase toxin, partial [Spirochaetaceae bacterium]